MAQQFPRLTLVIQSAAERDLYGIWDYNAATYNNRHADDYIAFLDRKTRQLETEYHRGRSIGKRPNLRYMAFKSRSRGAGYVAFYEVIGADVHILRYLHTSRDWQGMAERGEV